MTTSNPRRQFAARWLAAALGLLVLCGADRPESLAARRARLESLSPADKRELQRKYERFQKLSEEQQAQLRSLDQQIRAADDGQQLLATMTRYNQWLRSLPTGERAELLSLPAPERLARIARLREKQRTDEFRLYLQSKLLADDQDVNVVKRWFFELWDQKSERLTAHLPAEFTERLRGMSPEERRGMLFAGWMRYRPGSSGGREGQGRERPEGQGQGQDPFEILVENGDLQRLLEQLSPVTRKAIERESPERQRLLARELFWVAMSLRWRLPPVDDDDLKQFFDGLSKRQRDFFLIEVPADQMRSALTRYYHQQNRFGPGPPRGFGTGRGRRTRGGPGPGERPPRSGPSPGFPGPGNPPPPRRPLPDDAGEPTAPRPNSERPEF